jgi:hypothetical protein
MPAGVEGSGGFLRRAYMIRMGVCLKASGKLFNFI